MSLIITITLLCCGTTNKSNKDMDVLKLKLRANYTGMVGYGYLFNCEVIDVLEGELNDSTIKLIVMNDDKENYDFISNNSSPKEILLKFKLNTKNETYSLLPITGFVDGNKTSWVVQSKQLID